MYVSYIPDKTFPSYKMLLEVVNDTLFYRTLGNVSRGRAEWEERYNTYYEQNGTKENINATLGKEVLTITEVFQYLIEKKITSVRDITTIVTQNENTRERMRKVLEGKTRMSTMSDNRFRTTAKDITHSTDERRRSLPNLRPTEIQKEGRQKRNSTEENPSKRKLRGYDLLRHEMEEEKKAKKRQEPTGDIIPLQQEKRMVEEDENRKLRHQLKEMTGQIDKLVENLSIRDEELMTSKQDLMLQKQLTMVKDQALKEVEMENKNLKEAVEHKNQIIKEALEDIEEDKGAEELAKENRKMHDRIEKLEIQLKETETKLHMDNMKDLSTNAVAKQLVKSLETRVVIAVEKFRRLTNILEDAISEFDQGTGLEEIMQKTREGREKLNTLMEELKEVTEGTTEARTLFNEVNGILETEGMINVIQNRQTNRMENNKLNRKIIN